MVEVFRDEDLVFEFNTKRRERAFLKTVFTIYKQTM